MIDCMSVNTMFSYSVSVSSSKPPFGKLPVSNLFQIYIYVKMFKIFLKNAQRITQYTLLNRITQNQQILRFGQFVSNKEIKHWRESWCPYFSLLSLISALLSTPATAVMSLVCTFSVLDSTCIKNVISIGSVGFYLSTWYHSVNIVLQLPFLHSTVIFEVYLHILWKVQLVHSLSYFTYFIFPQFPIAGLLGSSWFFTIANNSTMVIVIPKFD